MNGPEGYKDGCLPGHEAVVRIGEDLSQLLDVGPQPLNHHRGPNPAGADGALAHDCELGFIGLDALGWHPGEPAFRLAPGGEDGRQDSLPRPSATAVHMYRAERKAAGDLDRDLVDHHPKVSCDDEVAGLVVGDDAPAGRVDLRCQLPGAGPR